MKVLAIDAPKRGLTSFNDFRKWFADIFTISAILHQQPVDVVSIDLPLYNWSGDGRCRDYSDEVYGYDLKTQNGTCTIVFRNSSNGYYGGWLDCLGSKEPTVGYGYRDKFSGKWLELTEDYPFCDLDELYSGVCLV